MLKFFGLIFCGISSFLFAYYYSGRFFDWLRFQSLGTRDYIVEKLALMFIEISAERILLGLMLISFGLGSAVFLVFLPRIFPGLPLAIITTFIGWKVPKPIVDWAFKRRLNQFVMQMVDGLSLMSNGLKSGLSVVQSLALVTQEMPNPIQQEFNLVLSENKLGVSLEDAFSNLAKRMPADDVEMFVTSVNILKETGGNLAETFDTIVVTIRERVKVESKISALTTQGFYQGMIALAMPFFLAVILSQSDPELMRPLFTTFLGWMIILIIIVLETVGFFVIMRLTKIDV